MSGLLFLNATDLVQKQGDKGMILCIHPEPKGMTMVMFYSKDCEHCKTLFANFKQLPYFVTGCQFAIFNVDLNPQIVEQSKPTICPITYVPDVILYVDGSPYIRYDGGHEMVDIQSFLQQIYEKLKKTSFFKSSENNNNTPNSASFSPSPSPHQQQQQQQQHRTGTQTRGEAQFMDPRVDFQQNQRVQQPPHPQSDQNPSYVHQANGNRIGPLPPLSQQPNQINQMNHPYPPSSSTPPPYLPVQQQQQQQSAPSSEIPAYTIGKPVCSGPDEKCYLAFSDAYGK